VLLVSVPLVSVRLQRPTCQADDLAFWPFQRRISGASAPAASVLEGRQGAFAEREEQVQMPAQQQGPRRDAASGGRAAARRGARAIAIAAAVAAAAVPAAAAAGTGGQAARPAAAPGSHDVLAWGYNGDGELGSGSTDTQSLLPVGVRVPAGTRVTSVRAGCQDVVALTRAGRVLDWGANNDGELGNGTTSAGSRVPVRVALPPRTTVTAVRTGCDFSLALTSGGQVLSWGLNARGQLGLGTRQRATRPVVIPLKVKVTAITTGENFAVALTSTGQLVAWGDNSFGQLGRGSVGGFARTPAPVKLSKGTRITAVAAGEQHVIARNRSGQLLSWGNNDGGALGNGRTDNSNENRSIPGLVRLPKGVKTTGLAAGESTTLALTSTGNVLAWGLNLFGEVGDGTDTDRLAPVQVQLPAGVRITAVSEGIGSSMALDSQGRVWTWGYGGWGQHATGDVDDALLPVQAGLPAGKSAIAIGAGPQANTFLAIVVPAR
jgi:alpha-tubulin suppressor-like RCC1 family protein